MVEDQLGFLPVEDDDVNERQEFLCPVLNEGARDFILAPVEGTQDEKKPQLLNEPSIETIGDSSDNAPSPAQSVGSP